MFHVAVKYFHINLKYYLMGRLESYGSGEGPLVGSGERSGPLQDYTK
jgi:hypothetical protein